MAVSDQAFVGVSLSIHLVNESEVMGDKHEASLEALDGISQGVNGFNVQMVGGLIQQQQVGVLHADHAKHNAALLAVTQLPNLGCLHLACNSASDCISRQASTNTTSNVCIWKDAVLFHRFSAVRVFGTLCLFKF